ncbi:MAG: hypothetical protein ACJARD_000964 [Alphaproteobacteria bacterium]|jgi:hypothetical protein
MRIDTKIAENNALSEWQRNNPGKRFGGRMIVRDGGKGKEVSPEAEIKKS